MYYIVVAVVVRHWLIGSKQFVIPEEQTPKNTRTNRTCIEIHLELGIPMINYTGTAKSHATNSYYMHHTCIVQSKSHHASSTEITSKAAAFWEATDAAASASQSAINVATSWRTSASPGIKCELGLSIILSILSGPREVRSRLTTAESADKLRSA